MLPFLIAGLTTGSVYGLAGVGLVLTYKTSGIFNFAHGSLATVSAFLFYTLTVDGHLPWSVAAAVCVFLAGPALGLGLELMSRYMHSATLTVRVVATVGLLLAIQSVIVLLYGDMQRRVPQYLPTVRIPVGSTSIGVSDIVVVVVGLVASVTLFAYFRVSRTGVAMRAVVDNADLLSLAGTNPGAVRRYAWVIGSCFASLSGVLLAPLVPLDAITMTLLVVQAFGAAAIGRFNSLPLTYVGGLVIGVLASLATKFFTSGPLAGLPAALPFAVLFIVLLVSRRNRRAEMRPPRPAARVNWRAPWQIQTALAVCVVAIFVAVPSFATTHLTDWTLTLSLLIVLSSLGLLVRSSGQVSLGHVAFMAIGAAAFAHFTSTTNMNWGLALLLAGLVAIPVGALLSIPAIRLSGLYLALATFGFGILVSVMFYTSPFLFGDSPAGLVERRPSLRWLDVESDRGYYYLVLALALVVCAVVGFLEYGRLGRLLRALKDSPRGLASCGTSVNVTRVLVFCMSAFLASIGGALGGVAQGVVIGDSYPPLLSLTLFVVTIITIGGDPWYAALGAAGLTLIPSYFPGSSTNNVLTLIFGAAAVFYALTPESKRGLPQALAARIDSRLRPGTKALAKQVVAARAALNQSDSPIRLDVTDLTVRFGGVVAVDQVTIAVTSGQIVGLIGPNGAGKTTTFDAISGLNRPSAGHLMLDDHDISRLGTAARARKGLGRTFQLMELFDSLTVRDNIELGAEAASADWNVFKHVARGPASGRVMHQDASEVIDLCGLSELSDRVVSTLSTGQRRLVELARCLAGPFRLILLDEPSSGLDAAETRAFGEILRIVVRTRGTGILLVEHDMSLVTSMCDFIYVMDFGEQIFAGTAAEVVASDIVRSAYLGADVPALAEQSASAAAGEARR